MSKSFIENDLPYIPAEGCHVTVKNHLLFAAASCFLLVICFMHFSVYGLMSLLPVSGCMFAAGCLFPSGEKPAHSLKYKATHYLFFFVIGLCAILLFDDMGGYAELAVDLLPNWVSVALILKGVLAVLVVIVSFFISNAYLKKTLHYVSALCILWMMLGLLESNTASYLLAFLLLVWFYFLDITMIIETEDTLNERSGLMAGALELAICGPAALFIFKPFQESWTKTPFEMVEAVLRPVPLLYLLLAALCMVGICAKFHPAETLSNNESAAFFTVFTSLVLMKLAMELPFSFGFVTVVVYLVVSVPFMTAVGSDSALADFASQVEIAPWVLHLLISVQAVAAYCLLYAHMWICTIALVFSPYLLMFGTLFERINNQRFRWHAYLAVIFAAFLALCADIRVFRVRAVVIELLMMLLLQGAVWIWDDQFSAEKKALERCKESADRLLGKKRPTDAHEKQIILVKSLIVGGYILFSAILLRKMM